jgi:hypothetical protein
LPPRAEPASLPDRSWYARKARRFERRQSLRYLVALSR